MIAAIKNRLGFGTSVLGIDIGTSSIKMARVETRGGLPHVVNRVVLPIDPVVEEQTAAETLSAALAPLKTRALPGVLPSSCVLPRSNCDIRSVEVPPGSDDDVLSMATEALRDCFVEDFDDRVTQVWRQNFTAGSMATMTCVSVPSRLPGRVVASLDEAGMQCESVQGHPFVMAAAAQLCPGGQGDAPIAMLDWGYSTVSLTIVRSGQPEFVRVFRTCGGKKLIGAIAQEMNLSPSDAGVVLSATRLPRDGDSKGPLFPAAADLLMAETRSVATELTRTLRYLQQHISALVPRRLLLLGGMAAIPNLADTLQDMTALDSRPWSFGVKQEHASEPVYAAAVTLSAGVCS